METITKHVNDNMDEILTSLDQEPLSDEEAKLALQDMLAKFEEPSFFYDEDIDFEDSDQIKRDLQIARKMIMETIDKSKKISDVVISTLIVDTANPTFLQLAQDANRTIQQSVKSLSDIHASYSKIKAQNIRNRLLDKEPSDEDDIPDAKKHGISFEE